MIPLLTVRIRIDDYPDTLINTIDSSSGDPSAASSSSSTAPSTSSASTSSSHRTPPRSSNNSQRPTTAELMETCRAFFSKIQQGSAPWVNRRLNDLPPMPNDPGMFSFWAGNLLPFNEIEKARLLPIRSARLRLLLVVHWVEQLNETWYVKTYFISAFFRWVIWKAIEFMAACLVWLVSLLLRGSMVGGRTRNYNSDDAAAAAATARWKNALLGAAYPAILVAFALWWAV